MIRHHLRRAAIAALPGFALFALLPLATQANTIGVAAAVNPDASGTPPEAQRRIIEVGTNMLTNEKVVTGPSGQAQLIFNDGSAFSIGPNSELTLDKFVYDPERGSGQMALSVTKGVFRFVGGKISKENPVQIKVGTATMGIRGGIATLTVQPGQPVVAKFLFGREMTLSQNGITQITTRPGTAIEALSGAAPSAPRPVSATEMRQTITQLEARPTARAPTDAPPQPGQPQQGQPQQGNQGAGGPNPAGPPPGAPPPPTAAIENRLDTSGISGQNSAQGPGVPIMGPPGPPPPPPGQLAPDSLLRQPPNEDPTKQPTPILQNFPGREGRFLFGNNGSADIFSGAVDTNTGTATRNTDYDQRPTGFQILTSNGASTLRTAINATPFSTATAIELPIQTGSFAFSSLNTPYGVLDGKAFASGPRDFFFYSMQATSDFDTRSVVFAGVPTLVANFPTSGLGMYNIVGGFSGIPYIGHENGAGSLGANTTLANQLKVSPLYTIYSANMAPNQLTPSGSAGHGLQATIGISGQGATQSSVLVGMTSVISSDPVANDVALAGGARGSYRNAGADYLIRYNTGVSSSATGASGSATFGPGGEFMVLSADQATFNSGTNALDRTTAAGIRTLANGTAEDYFFVDRAVRQPNSAIVNTPTRTTRVMQGYSAGLAERNTATDITLRNTDPLNVTISTNATSNRVTSTFTLAGGDARTYQLEFGDTSGGSLGHSSFINDSLFGAREAANRTSQIGGANVDTERSLMVTHNVASISSNALPSGVSLCTCDFLQWGWWISSQKEPAAGPLNRVHLASWVTGVLPALMDVPTTGTASFNGHAVGNVNFNGNRYVAFGTYTQSWNFATQSGQSTISNFDNIASIASAPTGVTSGNNREFSGSVSGTGSTAGASTNGLAVTGTVNGSFFRGGADPVKAAAGSFQITGTNYQAVGTFAAQKP